MSPMFATTFDKIKRRADAPKRRRAFVRSCLCFIIRWVQLV